MQPKVESLSRGMRFAPGIVLGLAARAEVTMSTSRMPGWDRWPDSSSATGCLRRVPPDRAGGTQAVRWVKATVTTFSDLLVASVRPAAPYPPWYCRQWQRSVTAGVPVSRPGLGQVGARRPRAPRRAPPPGAPDGRPNELPL
jgi:hypothetical protein